MISTSVYKVEPSYIYDMVANYQKTWWGGGGGGEAQALKAPMVPTPMY